REAVLRSDARMREELRRWRRTQQEGGGVCFTATAAPEFSTLSLHDALPISPAHDRSAAQGLRARREGREGGRQDVPAPVGVGVRSEEHTSELQSQSNLVCRLLLEKKKVMSAAALAEVAVELGLDDPLRLCKG